MPTLWTAANVFFPDLFKQLPHSETGIPLLKLLVSLEFKNKLQIFGFHAVVQKAIITDFLETGWKHMHKEAPDKLLITEGNRTMGAPVFLIEGVFKGIPAKVCFLPGEGKGDFQNP